jgi:hypothetical protein
MLRQIPEVLSPMWFVQGQWPIMVAPAGAHRLRSTVTQDMAIALRFDNEEDGMKRIITLVVGGLALLTGCGTVGDTASKPPAPPKFKAPYRIEFATGSAKPNPAGVTIPGINYTATSKVLERRAALVVQLDTSAGTSDQPAINRMIMGPVDIPDTAGSLPANYMDLADKGLGKLLADACMKGTVKVKVVLVRSSIKPDAGDGEIDAKRLSDWLPAELAYKNPHPKC